MRDRQQNLGPLLQGYDSGSPRDHPPALPQNERKAFHNIVQDAVTKTIPKKKKCKKIKCLSEEALQIAEERREVKGKGEG